MHKYRNFALNILLVLLILFAVIALYAFVHLQRQVTVLNLGLNYFQENMIIFVLSILSMFKVVWEIYKVEHPREYEERIVSQVKSKS